MLLKFGVNIIGLQDCIREKLAPIDVLWKTWGEEAVITSGLDSAHSTGSLHYVGRAIDLRFPKNRTPADAVAALKTLLGKDYDVVLERDHVHIEFDPE